MSEMADFCGFGGGGSGGGFLRGPISTLQMLPSGSGSPRSAERPSCHLSHGATRGGRIYPSASFVRASTCRALMRSWAEPYVRGQRIRPDRKVAG